MKELTSDQLDRLGTLILKAREEGDVDAAAEAKRMLDGMSVQQLEAYEQGLIEQMNDALVKRAAATAHIGGAVLAGGTPVPIDFHAEAARVARGGGPAGVRVLAGLLLLEHANDVIPSDERSVAKALDPLRRPDFNDYRDVNARTIALLRTASYYVLDARDCYDALASDPPVQETFPPLPFPRVWIEAHLPGQATPTPYLRFAYPGTLRGSELGELLDVLGVGIVEVERGRTWDLYVGFRPGKDEESYFFGARITPQAVVAINEEGQVADRCFETIRALAVGGAHLITARNVPHTEFLLPRAQRRRLRDSIPALPKMYYVDLAAAGESDFRETGRSYSVRWLVRGHWRHMVGGQTLCTCCTPGQVATWIDPYVKGPAGAPWKGRPVHRSMGVEAA